MAVSKDIPGLFERANAGGFSQVAMAISSIYIPSLLAAWFLAETEGKPLPE